MTDSELQSLRLAGFAAAAAVALVWQRLRPHDRGYRARGANLGLWVIGGVVTAAVCGGCAFSAARWAGDAGVGLLHAVTLPPWAGVLIVVLGLDAVSYAWHRANHRVPFLWRFHQVHHSDASFTVSTALRFHPGELLLSLPVRLLAVLALGAPPLAVLSFEVWFALANLVEHGNIDLPARLERRAARLLVTPALHRRHHASQRPDLDRNFGTIFSVWDRLLGTYAPSTSAARIAVGLPGHAGVHTLGAALWLPVARARDRSS